MPFLNSTQLQCPACRRPFNVQLEQIIDAGSDPGGKERLLSGRLNIATCPQCGNSGMLNTPLLYHDPAHELLLVYTPMELNLPQNEREQLIGGLTRNLMASIPANARKGYLFNPQSVLTMDSLIERILEADGVSPQMLAEQRQRGQLLTRLLSASEPELKPLVKAHDDELDEFFFQLLAAVTDSAQREGRQDEVSRLVQLRNRLVSLASWSRRQGITPQMLDEQQARMDLMELFLAADESEWPRLARQHDKKLDYLFFQLLSVMAQRAPKQTAAVILKLRDQLADLTSTGRDVQAGQRAMDGLRSAADAAGGLTREMLLEQLVNAEGNAAVEILAIAGGPVLDYGFFLLLADKIDAVKKQGNQQEAARLDALRNKLVMVTEEWEQTKRARAERVYGEIDELFQAKDRGAVIKRLLPEVDEFFLSLLAGRAEAAKRAGQEDIAGQLEQLLGQIIAQIQANAPPEVQLVNNLLELETKSAIYQALVARREELTPVALGVMEELLQDARAKRQNALAGRLQTIIESAKRVAG